MATERVLIEVSERGVRTVRRDLEGMGREAAAAGVHVDLLKRGLLGLAAGFTLARAVSELTAFSREMARIGVATGATGAQLEGLRETVRRVGLETNKTATESAQAFSILARAGVASEKSLRATLRLSAAAASGTASTAAALANLAQAYTLSAEEAAEATDALAVAASRTNNSLEELAQGVTRTAVAAKAAGVSVKEITAVTSVLADSGVNSRLALMQLKTALEALERPSDDDRAALAVLGIEIEKVRPSAVGLSAALEELARRGGRLEDRFKGGLALDILKDRAGDVKALFEAMEKSTGTAEKFAKIMDSSLAGAFERVQVTFSNLVTSFEEAELAGMVTDIANSVAHLAQVLAAIPMAYAAIKDLLPHAGAATGGKGAGVPDLPDFVAAGLNQMSTAQRKRFNDEMAALREELARSEVLLSEIKAQAGMAGALKAAPTKKAALDTALKTEARDAESIERENRQIDLQISLTKQLTEERDRLAMTEGALGALLEKNLITQDQYNMAMANATLESARFADGLDTMKASLMAVDTSVGALGASIGDELVGAIDQASGALADFAISGFRDVESLKAALSDLLKDLAKQIIQLIIKMLILKAIQAAIGGVGGGAGGALSPASGGVTGASSGALSGITVSSFQSGGPVSRGRPIRVGERGEELFVPPSQGNILPAGHASGAQPEMAVTIVNVTDPSQVQAGIQTPDGQKAVLNVIQQNGPAIKRMLG